MTLLAFLIWCFCIFILHRESTVHTFRLRMSHKVHFAATEDIFNGRPYNWRWEVYDSVSPIKMALQFWKPLRPESFYKDTSFLEPSNEND